LGKHVGQVVNLQPIVNRPDTIAARGFERK
jgi:hypothetical protein